MGDQRCPAVKLKVVGKVGGCPDVQWVGNEMCPCGKLGMVVKLDG